MKNRIILGKSIKHKIDHTNKRFYDEPYVNTVDSIVVFTNTDELLSNLVSNLTNPVAFTFVPIIFER